ncbi:MAG TPA: hypothetical protein VMQ78_11285 [Candidatus Limnocylindria bacterium]|nr:hypothetical protein [Candidatus Limnocylindria bacterium]
MRRTLLSLAAAVLLAANACSAAGGGSGAPQASSAPSLVPTPTGSAPAYDEYGY